MGSYNPQIQEMVGVDDVEVFIDHLTEHGPFPSEDPEEDYKYNFYDVGGRDLPYTMMSVLEYYYKRGRSVKVTVEDAGPSDPDKEERKAAQRAAHERALVALEAEARDRARNTHRPQY